jgi:hypothetical protein
MKSVSHSSRSLPNPPASSRATRPIFHSSTVGSSTQQSNTGHKLEHRSSGDRLTAGRMTAHRPIASGSNVHLRVPVRPSNARSSPEDRPNVKRLDVG